MSYTGLSPSLEKTMAIANLKGPSVSLYFFRISHGKHAGVAECAFDLLDRDAAWKEMTRLSSDLVTGICRNLKQRSDWRMELLDELGKPRLRIRLVAETLD